MVSPDRTEIGNVNVIKRIGLGTHAEVYEVVPQESTGSLPQSFAMKVEKPIKQAFGVLRREIDVLRSLSHLSCVPRVLGEFSVSIDSTDCFAFGLEQFTGSLSMLKQHRPTPGHMDVILPFLFCEMFTCVSALHEAGILHRDLKPSNFMFKLAPCGSVRIAVIDFGSAIAIGCKNETEFRGTGAYLPIDSDPWESTCMDDFWSLAFTLLDLAIVGGLPWRSTSARTAEGRAEIRDKKMALMAELENCLETSLVDAIPSFLKQFFFQLNAGKLEIPDSTIPCDPIFIVHIFSNLIRPSHKDNYLIESMCGNQIRIHGGNFFAFKPPNDTYLRSVSSLVSAFRTRTSHHICVSQLLTGDCNLHGCPLKHYQRGGIVESAVRRRFRGKNTVCVFHLLTGKCKTRPCSQIHLKDIDLIWS